MGRMGSVPRPTSVGIVITLAIFVGCAFLFGGEARWLLVGIAVGGGSVALLFLVTTRERPDPEPDAAEDDTGAETDVETDPDTSRERLAAVERQRDDFEILYRFTDQVSRAVLPAERRQKTVELATRFLGRECVLVRVDDPTRAEAGTGRITMREGETIEDHVFAYGPEGQRGVPTFLDGIIQRWLSGEFDGRTEVESGWVVVYPLRRMDRHLGLLLLPAPKEDGEGPPPSPELVRALTDHVAVALEFSDVQSEQIGQERLAAVGETVAGLAHCLKNTLNGLRAGQYVIDRAVGLANLEKVEKGWMILKRGIGKVETLTYNMLYVIRERKPKREPVDPNDVVCEVVDIVHQAAEERGILVRGDLDPSIGVQPLDRLPIYRALLNLVSNAIDACVEGGSRGLVLLKSKNAGDEIVLSVEDSGVGMSPETQARLFTRFFSTKHGQGTGLGLPVVRKIVEEHGGRLVIDSEPGRGSTFSIHLPRGETPD